MKTKNFSPGRNGNSRYLFPLLAAWVLLVSGGTAIAQGALFHDSTDQAFDISPWLMQKEGFLPVPMVITEPAVGYGGAVAFLFFHSSFLKKKGPPNITGVAGGGTQNGTWGAGVFHAGFYRDDRIRYTGSVFRTNINLRFYGPGLLLPEGIGLNLDSWLLYQQLKFRLGESPFFAGMRYLMFSTHNTFEQVINLPDFTGLELTATLSEVSVILNYESRNNIFTPTRGFYAQLAGTYSDSWLGGEALYGRINSSVVGFVPLPERFNLGLRWESVHALGDIPFWARPMVVMRGVPAMKYQNNHVSLAEAELSYNLYRRWYWLVFAGLGNTYESFTAFDNGKAVHSLGTGFRYEIARLFGLKMGADIAWSNQDFAFYIVMGHAWLR